MKDIGIVVDSACDLPHSFAHEHGVVVLPTSIRIGERMIIDRRDPLETADFYSGKSDGHVEDLVESSPLSVSQIESLFLDRLVLEFDNVIGLTVTSARSKIYENAVKASFNIANMSRMKRRRANLESRFHLSVINSGTMFAGQAVQAAEIIRMITRGKGFQEIDIAIRSLSATTHSYTIPNDLYYVYKRASKRGDTSLNWGTYTVGKLLDVKPIVHAHQNHTEPAAKVRGFENAAEKVFATAEAQIRRGLKAPFVVVSYAGDTGKVATMPGYGAMVETAEEHGVQVLLSVMSVTASVFAGPGAISIGFAADPHNLA